MAGRFQPPPPPPPPPPATTDDDDKNHRDMAIPPSPPHRQYYTDDDHLAIQIVLPSSTSIGPHDTYIVQMPKDQIYWVPPPENAKIVKRHRQPARKKRRCTPCACYAASSLVAIALLATTITLIYKFTLSPKHPSFAIKDFSVKEYPNPNPKSSNSSSAAAAGHHAPPLYSVTIQATNPNALNSVGYQAGPAQLWLGDSEVATGQTPAVSQAVKGIDKFHVVLVGRSGEVPKAIKQSMKLKNGGKNGVKLIMKMTLRMQKKTWLMVRKELGFVNCEFVVGSAGHGQDSSVKSQRCYYV